MLKQYEFVYYSFLYSIAISILEALNSKFNFQDKKFMLFEACTSVWGQYDDS